MTDLHIGDIVQLKLGGPQMLVGKLFNSDAVCYWFSEQKGEIIRQPLPVELLRKVKGKEELG